MTGTESPALRGFRAFGGLSWAGVLADAAKMTAVLRPVTPADRPDLIALALAEDAAWSGAPAVSAEEAGELIDRYRPGVIFERDGRVGGYAAVDEGGGTILLADPGDPVSPL